MKRWICAVLSLALMAVCLTGLAAYATLRPGARGQEVVALQRALIAQGHKITADGVYGRETRLAVRRYQAAHGLRQDGIAGNQTLTKLYDAPAPTAAPEQTPVPEHTAAPQQTAAPSTAPPTNAAPVTYGTVRPGARGAPVIALQQALNLHGFPLALDGNFGRMTRNALKTFQSRNGLKADGIAGAKTWALLLTETAGATATPGNIAQTVPATPTGAATAPPDSAGASVAQTLTKGSDASQIRLLQAALTSANAGQLSPDGEYSSRTTTAVRNFQAQYGLPATGAADPTTLALLYTKTQTPSQALMQTGINQTSGAVSMRSAARTSSGIVQTVPAGAAVTILEESAGWYHVTYKHRNGYMPTDALRILPVASPLTNLSRAFTQGAYTLSGDKKADLLGIAFTQLGFRGGSSESRILAGTGPGGPYSKYGAYYNDPSESYCSYFISWAARHADIPESVINNARDVDGVFYDQQKAFVYFFAPRAAQVQAQQLSPISRMEITAYTPEIGDLIYFRWSSARAATTFSHIGIVYDVDANYVYTLEGAAGGSVDTRLYRLTDSDIMGYARPRY